MEVCAPTARLHARIMTTFAGRFDMDVMNNVNRADYIECMIEFTLGSGWELTQRSRWDCAPRDLQRTSSARFEIKQAASRLSSDSEPIAKTRLPRFDIALRTGNWTKDGNKWINAPGRQADFYVFALHGER